jgi:hypothetical protein
MEKEEMRIRAREKAAEIIPNMKIIAPDSKEGIEYQAALDYMKAGYHGSPDWIAYCMFLYGREIEKAANPEG